MVLVIRSRQGSLRSTGSFTVSMLVHGALLAWVAFSPRPDPEPASVYDALIKPHEKEIIWYHPSGSLPEIKPAESRKDSRPPRALAKFDQTVVSGTKNTDARQMIYLPKAPEIEVPKPLPLPNVVTAVPVPQRPLRAFVTPTPKPAVRAPVTLPEAPLPVGRGSVSVRLPDAKAPPRAFTAPAPKPLERAAVTLPEAPSAGTLDSKTPSIRLPDAKAPLRTFTPPAEKATPAPPPDPTLPAPPQASQASLAIVSLDPSKLPLNTPPPGARPGEFAAGPKPQPEGGSSATHEAMLEVPGLLVRGGSQPVQPTLSAGLTPTQRNLLAGLRTQVPSPATRVSSAPDPRLEGRVVYTLAIEMPNVTSYSGSWMVWFAEHEAAAAALGEMIAPLALRKVDPGYIPSAIEERVEGVVRLFGVIRRDGHVDSIELVRHLDARLDRSAEQALAKWQFRPATRNGTPIDVDALFEVPFHLESRPRK